MNKKEIANLAFGTIASITAIAAIYISYSAPKPRLSAYIEKGLFYTPIQYNELMSKTLQNSSWDLIYKKLDTLAPEKSFKEKSELADEMFEKALTPWHKPFENGLESYRSLIFISIKNDGDAIANDVYLNLPEPALLMIENEGQEYSSIGPTKEYKIASIRQEGTYRVWAWIKSEKNKFNEYSIKIGSENQLASMEHARSYSGFPARIAENSTLFGVLFTAMFFTMLATIYIFFTTAPEKPKEIKAG